MEQESRIADLVQRSLSRPDGSTAPEPAAILGPALGTHFRLYPDAIVLVTAARKGQDRCELVHEAAQLTELQWGGTAKGRAFIRLEPVGSVAHLDISHDPTAVSCTPEELQVALRTVHEIYPALPVRRIAVLADVLGSIIFGSTEKRVRAALGFIPWFTADRHLAGSGRYAIALDSGQQKFCVIDVETWECRIYRPSDLLSVEVFEDSRVQVSHRRDGRGARALATGGFLVGDPISFGIGLAANNASKPKEQLLELSLRVAIDDPKMPICDVALSCGSTKLSGAAHRSLSADARAWASLIGALIRSSQSTPAPSSASGPPLSIAAELAQLAGLRQAGHLTDAEFVELKARLLSP